MRINLYAEELTDEVEVVRKEVDGQIFYGIRAFLKSPEELHATEDDDDRSAITFWASWSQDKEITTLEDLLSNMSNELAMIDGEG